MAASRRSPSAPLASSISSTCANCWASPSRPRPIPRAPGTPSSTACERPSGGNGWADVWMRGHFGWEYKGKHKDLQGRLRPTAAVPRRPGKPAAAGRLRHGPLRGPHELHRHGQAVHAFDLAGLADPANLDILRKVFTDPESLRPGITSEGSRSRRRSGSANWPTGCVTRGVQPHGRPTS